MELLRAGRKELPFEGECTKCSARYRAARSELHVEYCPREHYEFAHADCSECGKCNGVVLYPVTPAKERSDIASMRDGR
jgi:MinD superfamily P-loop ATPase